MLPTPQPISGAARHAGRRSSRWIGGCAAGLATLTVLLVPASASATPRLDKPFALTAPDVKSLHDEAAAGIVLARLQMVSPSSTVRTSLAQVRDRLATRAAAAVGAPPSLMRAAWARTDEDHLVALFAGITQLGVPYRSLRSEPGKAFDCSGFTSYAWGEAGLALAHQSGTQIRNAAKRDLFSARAGDLVYYPGHVMLYLGLDNFILHAPYSGQVVSFDTVSHGSRLRFGDPTG